MNIRAGQRIRFETITLSHNGRELVIRDVSATATGQTAGSEDGTRMLFTDTDKEILPGVHEVWIPIEEMDPTDYPRELFACAIGAKIDFVEESTTITLAGRNTYIPGKNLNPSEKIFIADHLVEAGLIDYFMTPFTIVADWRLERDDIEADVLLCKVGDVFVLVEVLDDDEGFRMMVPNNQESVAAYESVASETPTPPGVVSFITAAFRSDEWGEL